MNPIETLRHEHDTISLILDAAEREAQAFRASGKLDTAKVDKMVDFFRNYADRWHHMKEEQQLFKRMAERGVPFQGGPLGVMMTEHELGRHFLRETAAAVPLARAGSRPAMQMIADNLIEFVELLRAHIAKENDVLFPLADRLLTVQDHAELTVAFERLEAEDFEPAAHEKYDRLVSALTA